MIEITLTFQGKHVDLLIPGAVTFDRLNRLIGDAFAEKGTRLPSGYVLAFAGKALAVGGADLVASFGVGNGDQLQILVKE